jgi:hypothetical protein
MVWVFMVWGETSEVWHNGGMARCSARSLIMTACLVATLAATGAWLAQGRVLFTVLGADVDPSDRALERLFEPTGVQDELGAVRGMDRGFRLGLLPSGWGAGLVSVSTVIGAGACVWLVSSARRPSASSRRGRCRRPGCS